MSTQEELRAEVRNHYGAVARAPGACCAPGCCTPGTSAIPSSTPDATSRQLGYSADELAAVPEGANLGLGCGNPHAIAGLRPGETVVDLGSGGGFDCFLAARQVGPQGKVIGVDMTPDMLTRARANLGRTELANVDFRLGEIEHLPLPDASADVIISNCVINLSPDKPAVLREAWRVLRPGGRLAISDVVALRPVPPEVRRDLALYTGCVAGAATIDELQRWLAEAGFADVTITVDELATKAMADTLPETDISALAASARIEARRPAQGGAAR